MWRRSRVPETPPSLRNAATTAAAWSGLSTIVLRMGGLIVGVVLARLLTPEQFGVYAVALTVQAILMTVADLGLSADIIRSEQPDRIAPTVGFLGLSSGMVLTAVTIAGSGALAEAMHSPDAAPAIAVLAVTLLLGGATVVPYGLLQRRFQQRELFLVGAVDFTVSTAVTLSLVSLGYGVLGLAIGRVAAQSVSTVLQFYLAKVSPTFRIDRSVIRPVLAFGLPIAAANLLSWALLNVDNVILARVAGATALGYYVLAFNISSWPMSALSQVVRSVGLPLFSRTQGSTAALAHVLAVAWAAALPAGALLAALSGPLIEVVYGAKWRPSVPVLAALALYGSLRVVFDIFAAYLYSRGLSRPVLWIQIVYIVLLTGGMVVATTRWGIVGAGWAHVIAAAGVAIPLYLLVLHRSGVQIAALIRVVWVPTLATLPALGAAAFVDSRVSGSLSSLVLGGLVALAIYTTVVGRWLSALIRSIRSEDSVSER